MTFSVGSLVVLKSGGPTMTVNKMYQDDSCECIWFSGDNVPKTQKEIFSIAVLESEED